MSNASCLKKCQLSAIFPQLLVTILSVSEVQTSFIETTRIFFLLLKKKLETEILNSVSTPVSAKVFFDLRSEGSTKYPLSLCLFLCLFVRLFGFFLWNRF